MLKKLTTTPTTASVATRSVQVDNSGMATYVGGNGHQTSVLSIDFDSDTDEAELIVHAIDHNKREVVLRRKPLPIVSRGPDEIVVVWNEAEHRLVRTNKGHIDEKGRERDFVRVKGFGEDERGLVLARFYEDELLNNLEDLEYAAHVWARSEQGQALGPHLEPRFQRRYYHMDETAYILSLILSSLAGRDAALWEKYRVEPVGAVYATEDDSDTNTHPGATDYLPVTIIARRGDDVVFYNHWDEDFRLGSLTVETDASGDRIIQDRNADGSELSAVQRALDKEWNPERY